MATGGKALFERAIRIAPDDPHGYESLGTLFLDLGEAAKAREVLEQGSRLPQASEMLYVSLCDAWRALRQPGEALRVARQGMALMPGSALLDNARGLALEDAGRLEEALEAYRTAMARTPNSPEPVANLGVTLLRLGRRAEGEASLKQALAIQPMFSRALTTLARLELEAGRPQAAAPYIFPYFEQYPGFNAARELMAKYHLLLALEAVRGGDAAGAERACRDGLAIVPGAAELYGFLGVLCAQQRRMPEAVEALETAHRLLPTDIRVALSLSQLYFQLGRLDEARRLLTEGEQLARQRGETASADQIAGLLRKLPP